jgi:hypothetical protein
MNLGRAALKYAEMGIAVFRMSKQKVPFKGSHGELDGTTDPDVIRRWWRETPDACIAAALRFTDFFVLDIDGRHFGDEWLSALETEHGKLPHTATAISGSGNPSAHLWFKRTADLADVRCRGITVNRLKTGIDVKGLQGGYVVLPPSWHPSGNRYTWEASCRIDEVPMAEPPAWLVQRLLVKGSRRRDDFQHTSPVDPDSFYLGRLFRRAGLLGEQIRPGVFAVTCPNEAKHSQRSGSAGTVIFAPKFAGGRGTFFCSHDSHCSGLYR